MNRVKRLVNGLSLKSIGILRIQVQLNRKLWRMDNMRKEIEFKIGFRLLKVIHKIKQQDKNIMMMDKFILISKNLNMLE